jgi:transcriptional regulator with XRE-family HTH domain
MQETITGLQKTLTHIHLCVQLMQKKRLSYAEMAKLGGVATRTYAEWMRGGSSPAAAEAVLKMLALLPSDEIEKAIEAWRSPTPNLSGPHKKSGRTTERKIAAKSK